MSQVNSPRKMYTIWYLPPSLDPPHTGRSLSCWETRGSQVTHMWHASGILHTNCSNHLCRYPHKLKAKRDFTNYWKWSCAFFCIAFFCLLNWFKKQHRANRLLFATSHEQNQNHPWLVFHARVVRFQCFLCAVGGQLRCSVVRSRCLSPTQYFPLLDVMFGLHSQK